MGGGGGPGGGMGMGGPGRGRGRGRAMGGPGIRPDFGPGGPRMGRPGGNEGATEVQFAVPANKCGLVIGKGGETVRNINQQSGAHVEIARGAPPNPHEKIFIIRGNPQQIEHAKQLIMERVGGMVSFHMFYLFPQLVDSSSEVNLMVNYEFLIVVFYLKELFY